jgi:putative Holliday junction resolvase
MHQEKSFDNSLPLYPVIGIDYGTKHIGLAVTDNRGRIAGPLPTFHITEKRGKQVFIDELNTIISGYKAKRVVIGIPQAFEAKESESVKRIKNFIKILSLHIKIPIVIQDESFSTKNAQSMLLSIGKSQKNSRKQIDSMACTLFLQEFIDHENRYNK